MSTYIKEYVNHIWISVYQLIEIFILLVSFLLGRFQVSPLQRFPAIILLVKDFLWHKDDTAAIEKPGQLTNSFNLNCEVPPRSELV